MNDTILIGRGKEIHELPSQDWERDLAGAPAGIAPRLDFISPEHHLVRNFVVRELPRVARPSAPEMISERLALPMSRTREILADLERNLFFLVSELGDVSWAFPVTVDNTGHHLTFSTGERLDAA